MDFGATQSAVLPLGFHDSSEGGWDGTGKATDEKGEEGSWGPFRGGPQRPRDRDPLRSRAALGGVCPGAVRCVSAELARGPRDGRRGARGGALSGARASRARAGGGLGEGRDGSVRARRDLEAAVGGMARDASRRHELSDLVPPLPGMAAVPGRDDAAEPPSRRAAVRRLRGHDDPDRDRRGRAQGTGVRDLDGDLGAALRRGDADPEDRGLVRLARALLRGHGLRAAGGRGVQLRPGASSAPTPSARDPRPRSSRCSRARVCRRSGVRRARRGRRRCRRPSRRRCATANRARPSWWPCLSSR